MKTATLAPLALTLLLGQIASACDKGGSKFDLIKLQGEVVHQDTEFLDKTGEFKSVDAYYLVTSDGKVALPVPRHCNGEPKIDFPTLVGRVVSIKARGKQKPSDEGVLSYVHEVVSVERQPDYQSLSLRGTVIRERVQELTAGGEINTVSHYYLRTNDSTVLLPENSELRSRLGQQVTVDVLGIQKPNRDGKMLSYIHKVVDVNESNSARSATAGIANPFAVN